MESNQLHLNPVLNSTESKRAAPDNLAPENNNKQPRGPVADVGSQTEKAEPQLVVVLLGIPQCQTCLACQLKPCMNTSTEVQPGQYEDFD